MRCAIYARGSAKDKGTDVENRLAQLRRYATAQSWEITEFIDHESAKSVNGAQFQALFAAASRREIDLVLVWALDQFTGEGIAQTFLQIKRLLDCGVQFESLTESNFRTTGPAGEVMIAIAAWVAKQERIRLSDHIKAGLAVARAKGRLGGRARKVFEYAQTFLQIKRLLDCGVQFESLTESNFRTTGPAGEVMIAIAAWVAKQERIRLSDHIKAGLAVAAGQG